MSNHSAGGKSGRSEEPPKSHLKGEIPLSIFSIDSPSWLNIEDTAGREDLAQLGSNPQGKLAVLKAIYGLKLVQRIDIAVP
jgi:hypothetical protein